MACAGYDDSDSTLLVMNSFGQNWGTQGCVKIPYVNIRKKSFGAYAFPSNGPGKVPHFNATPVADSIRSGLDTTDITMRKGQYVIVNGIKLVFTDLTPNGVFALVAVSNTGSRNAPYVLRMQAGSDWTFFNNGMSITYSWSRPGGAGTDVVFRAITVPATDDPTIRAYQQQLREAVHLQQ
ncbi:MAG: hypothetical protein IPN38_17795 [Flavobacteriales bacterium]|nr:hypothetical protein [Flavobacteriales bacterium]